MHDLSDVFFHVCECHHVAVRDCDHHGLDCTRAYRRWILATQQALWHVVRVMYFIPDWDKQSTPLQAFLLDSHVRVRAHKNTHTHTLR